MKKIFWTRSNITIIQADREIMCSGIRVQEIGHNITTYDYHFSNMRNAWILHFVFSGSGSALDIPITAPKGFLLTPDRLQNFDVYITPKEPQWEHYWVMLRGDNVEEFLFNAKFPTTAGVFDIKNPTAIKNLFSHMFLKDYKENVNGDFLLNAFLFELFHINYNSHLDVHKKIDSKLQYVESAVAFIKQNYSTDITENDIALEVNLSAKYLYKLFKKYKEVSPIEYLNSYRITRAQALLRETSLSVSDIADAVGYNDPSYFIRVFKKYCAVTPSKFRHQSKKEEELQISKVL